MCQFSVSRTRSALALLKAMILQLLLVLLIKGSLMKRLSSPWEAVKEGVKNNPHLVSLSVNWKQKRLRSLSHAWLVQAFPSGQGEAPAFGEGADPAVPGPAQPAA